MVPSKSTAKVFHLNSHTIGIFRQTQKLEKRDVTLGERGKTFGMKYSRDLQPSPKIRSSKNKIL